MKALRLHRYTVPLLISVMIAVLLPLIAANRAQAAPGFVTTSGTKFMLDGKPFYVAGTNSHYLGWGTRAEVDSMLGYADASNYNVVRGILHSVTGSLDGTTKPHVWNPNSTGDASNMGMHGTYLIYWDTATNTYAFNPSTVNGLGRWDYVIARAWPSTASDPAHAAPAQCGRGHVQPKAGARTGALGRAAVAAGRRPA